MKKKITKEEYYLQNEEKVNQLLDIFELANLTFDEKIALLLPLIDSKSKLDYLKNIDKQNKELISQNEQIIEQNNKTVEQNQQIIDLLKEIKDK